MGDGPLNGKLKAARRARWSLGLSEQRVRAHIRNAKAIFNWARRFGLVTDNPFTDFDGAPRPTGPNHYVTLVDFVRLLRACRSGAQIQHGWRALHGLCRLAGLRRGEALDLPWSGKAVDSRGQEHWVGVDWERRRLHIMGNAKRSRTHRVVPICPRLYKILIRAFEAAPAGQAAICGLSAHNPTRHADEHIARAGRDPLAEDLPGDAVELQERLEAGRRRRAHLLHLAWPQLAGQPETLRVADRRGVRGRFRTQPGHTSGGRAGLIVPAAVPLAANPCADATLCVLAGRRRFLTAGLASMERDRSVIAGSHAPCRATRTGVALWWWCGPEATALLSDG